MKYFVFSRNDCPYCDDAIKLLKDKNLNFDSVVFYEEHKSILSEIKKCYEWPTVPIVLSITDKETSLIGGYTDLVEHLKNE
tara:strand:- start:436 stop:678 length:243 start_codon:yes stop_codon:yes gene_type:complete